MASLYSQYCATWNHKHVYQYTYIMCTVPGGKGLCCVHPSRLEIEPGNMAIYRRKEKWNLPIECICDTSQIHMILPYDTTIG